MNPRMNPNPLIPGRLVEGQLCVSNSLLKDIATCETRAYLSWVLRKTVEGEFGPMLLGTAIHLALACYFKGGTRKETMVVFRKAYKAWAVEHIDPNDKFNARLSWENTRKILRYWLDAHPIEQFPFTVDPALVEVPFATPLSKTIILRGILDLLVRHKESQKLYVLDHKSTGFVNSWWLQQFKLESQITGYMWGVQAQTDEEVAGGYINAIQMALLPGANNPTWKCRTHSVTYGECQPLHIGGELVMIPRTPAQTKMWRASAVDLALRFKDVMEVEKKQIQTLGCEGMFNGSCRTCNFVDFCRNGREPELIDTMLVDRQQEQEAYLE